jgi:hypothetical protein
MNTVHIQHEQEDSSLGYEVGNGKSQNNQSV